MNNKVIALMPMKGHSERVPNKNLRMFHGKPLYHHVLSTLQSCQSIKKIIINTDSQEITADIQANFNDIQIIERPDEISGDYVEMNKIISYDMSQVEGEYFIQTHSTNPLLKSRTIDDAIDTYFRNILKYDSVFTVTKLMSRYYSKSGAPINHSLNELIRTQDLPPIFEENSNLYAFSRLSFKNAKNNRIGVNPKMYEVGKFESIDIDTLEDFLLAEAVMKFS